MERSRRTRRRAQSQGADRKCRAERYDTVPPVSGPRLLMRTEAAPQRLLGRQSRHIPPTCPLSHLVLTVRRIRRTLHSAAAQPAAAMGCYPVRQDANGWSHQTAFDYSITRSARWSTAGGKLTPCALAVLRLSTNSKRVGCSTGSTAGFAPLKILSM